MKKLLVVLFICVFFLAGCNKTVNDVLGSLRGTETEGSAESGGNGESEAVKLNKDLKLYNDFAGVSYTVPKGWWVYDINEENFSQSQGDITDDVSMDISYDDFNAYSYAYADLISFGNLEKSQHENHLGFDLDIRSLKGQSGIDSFMKYYEEFMLEPTDEAEYELLESEQASIGGKTFEIRIYLLDRGEDNYHILTATCPVKEGYFFSVEANYWPENTKAKQMIIDQIKKNVTFY